MCVCVCVCVCVGVCVMCICVCVCVCVGPTLLTQRGLRTPMVELARAHGTPAEQPSPTGQDGAAEYRHKGKSTMQRAKQSECR